MSDVTVHPETRAGDPFLAAVQARAERGLELFLNQGDRIRYLGDNSWFCPSQREDSTAPPYVVHNGPDATEACSCPDWQYRGVESGVACKHIAAVAISCAKVPDGKPVTSITFTLPEG